MYHEAYVYLFKIYCSKIFKTENHQFKYFATVFLNTQVVLLGFFFFKYLFVLKVELYYLNLFNLLKIEHNTSN